MFFVTWFRRFIREYDPEIHMLFVLLIVVYLIHFGMVAYPQIINTCPTSDYVFNVTPSYNISADVVRNLTSV